MYMRHLGVPQCVRDTQPQSIMLRESPRSGLFQLSNGLKWLWTIYINNHCRSMGWSSKYQLLVFVRLIVSSATALSLANYCSAWKSFKCQLQLGLLQKVVYNSNFHLFFDNFWNGMKFHIRKPIKISKVGGLHFFHGAYIIFVFSFSAIYRV